MSESSWLDCGIDQLVARGTRGSLRQVLVFERRSSLTAQGPPNGYLRESGSRSASGPKLQRTFLIGASPSSVIPRGPCVQKYLNISIDLILTITLSNYTQQFGRSLLVKAISSHWDLHLTGIVRSGSIPSGREAASGGQLCVGLRSPPRLASGGSTRP